jgi:hypothetical protein
MGSKNPGKMIVHVESKGTRQTLKDEVHGRIHFESSCYLNNTKMLLKQDASLDHSEILIMCTKLGKGIYLM